MTYVLFILFVMGQPGAQGASIATYSAEFASRDACWSASEDIRAPFDREGQYQITTVTTCVAKGQQEF